MTSPEATVFPRPSPWAGLGAPQPQWWHDGASWVSGGTEALYWAFRRLEAAGARPFVWIPSYHCGLEVQAALDAEWEVGFLPVSAAMAIRPDALRQALQAGPATVLLIHYYGFVHAEVDTLRRLVHEAGAVLLEDCTHALGSTVGLEAGADVSVFSLHKSLPVVDGGILEVEMGRIEQKLGRRPGAMGALARSTEASRRWTKTTIKALLGPAVRLRSRPDPSPDDTTWSNHETQGYGRRTSWWTRRVAQRTNLRQLTERRRRHYRALLEALDPSHPAIVFPRLADGDCPLGLPLRVSDRKGLLHELRASSIEPYVFGEFAHPILPADDFPATRRLRDEIVAIPVHDRLTAAEIRDIAQRTRPLLQRRAIEPTPSRVDE